MERGKADPLVVSASLDRKRGKDVLVRVVEVSPVTLFADVNVSVCVCLSAKCQSEKSEEIC